MDMKKQIFIAFLVVSLFLPLVSSAADLVIFFPRDLTVGAKGEDVSRLQQFLAKDSSIYPEGLATGYFGALTQKAVTRFQQKNNITPTRGYVGPLTRTKLEVLVLGSASNNSVTPSQNNSDLASLLKQLADLQAQILALRQTTIEAATTTIATTTPIAPTPTAAPPAFDNSVTISGDSTTRIAESLKMGDITLTNNSSSTATVFHITLLMKEALDASNMRGATFKMTLRNGSTTFDEVLEKKDVTVSIAIAAQGTYNTQLLTFYAGVPIPASMSKTFSLWGEVLKGPFNNGEIQFVVSSILTVPELPNKGGAALVLNVLQT